MMTMPASHLSTFHHQAIIWTNADLMSVGSSGTSFSEILIKIQMFIEKNALQDVICKMAALF